MKEKFKLYLIIILILPILTIFSQSENAFFINHLRIREMLGSVHSNSQLFSFYDFVNKPNLLKSGSIESVELDSIISISVSGNRSKYSYYYDSQNSTKSFYIDYFINNHWEQGWRIIYS